MAPALAHTPIHNGLRWSCCDAISEAVTRTLSPGNGMPSDSKPITRPTITYTSRGGMASSHCSIGTPQHYRRPFARHCAWRVVPLCPVCVGAEPEQAQGRTPRQEVRSPMRILGLLLGVLLLAGCAEKAPAPEKFQFTAKTLEGAEFRGDKLVGQPAVLW